MTRATRVALIAGASRGIGRAVCLRLSAGGAFTYVNYLQNEKAARETMRLLKAGGGDGELCRFDVSDHEAVTRAVHTIIAQRERIDILVNNAGMSLFSRPKRRGI